MEIKLNIFLSRQYNSSPEIIFDKIRKGLLFKLTGADKVSFDFKEGGTFLLEFGELGKVDGTFIEIIPDKKVILIWNVTGFGKSPEVNTKVIISITEKDKTILSIDHSEIKSKDAATAKEHGWTEILADLEREL